MEPIVIGLRAQDFHESLRAVGPFAPKEISFKRTVLIGKAAALAMHLRGLLYIDEYTQLEYAAAALGIGSLELLAVLRVLEDVSFLSIVKAGEEIKRIDLRVPEFRSGYSDLGERWKQLKPTDVEQAGLITLERLYNGPINRSELNKMGLRPEEIAALSDVMSAGQLLAQQPVDGEQIIYTPLAVDGNPQTYLEWAKRFPGEVQVLLQRLRCGQGLTIRELETNAATLPAIGTGVLMPVEVNGPTGPQRFLFSPEGGLRPEERTILNKARAIVSCVRYGQKFSAGRPIRFPRRIVETLRDTKRFKRGHPDLFLQYGLLAENLIGHPVAENNGHWNFEVDDTNENMKALTMAAEMIEIGESPSAHIDPEAQKALLAPSGFLGPPSARPKMNIDPQLSLETRSAIIKEMMKLARGMSARD